MTRGQVIAIDGKTLRRSYDKASSKSAIHMVSAWATLTREIRYYILSQWMSAAKFAGAVRSHWGIENSLHWQLDVTFAEDQCRIRKGHADANFSSLRRFALSLLKNNKTAKLEIKNKRLAAGWDDEYLAQLLCGN